LKTVKKALAILDSFTPDVPRQGVTQLASKLSMPKSTIHALLTALREEGYILYDPGARKYSLGFKPLELARRIRANQDLRDLSLPFMEALSKTCEEDVALNILVEGRRVCIALVESRYFVRQFVPVGKALPLHCSAAGKALMAYLPQMEIDAILKRYGLPRFTPNTITDKERLMRELENVKKRGYAESREEFGKDAAALAFPIFTGRAKDVAAISIQSTVNRLTQETRQKYIHEGLQASQKISSLLSEATI
jgi:DNA-binding IclR family transcriptional regulator